MPLVRAVFPFPPSTMRSQMVLVATLTTVTAVSVGGQTTREITTSSPVDEALERSRNLHERMQPADAMDLYRSLVERYPENPEVLSAAAGEALTLGILAEEESDALRWYRESEEYARRSVDANPALPDAHYWLAASLGRRALRDTPRRRIRLAGEIRKHALEALDRDSTHAGAHHVLGHWHAEVERTRGLSRFFAERILGAEIFEHASWEEALAHLRRAVVVQPEVLFYRLELARALRDRGQEEEAWTQLREVLERPTLDPIDPLMKQRAQELLKSIRRAPASEPLRGKLESADALPGAPNRVVHPGLHVLGQLVPAVLGGVSHVSRGPADLLPGAPTALRRREEHDTGPDGRPEEESGNEVEEVGVVLVFHGASSRRRRR